VRLAGLLPDPVVENGVAPRIDRHGTIFHAGFVEQNQRDRHCGYGCWSGGLACLVSGARREAGGVGARCVDIGLRLPGRGAEHGAQSVFLRARRTEWLAGWQ